MRRTGPAEPHKRDGIWYLIRRVPKEFEHLDRRGIVRISTEIAIADDPRGVRAKAIVAQQAANLEAYWRGMRDGQSAEARIRFEAAQKRAKVLGVSYQTVQEIRAEGLLENAVSRIELLLDRKLIENEDDVAAVLGGEQRPQFKVSDLPDEFEKLNSANLTKYSDRQKKRWKNPKAKAVKNFILAVGSDMDLAAIKRRHGLLFREWWQAKLVEDNLEIGTANKDIGHMNKMMRTVSNAHHLELDDVFGVLRLEGETTGSRAAFDVKQAVAIIQSTALGTLNAEARDIALIVADSGMRPSEICGMMPHHIRLAGKVPYVTVVPEERMLKNAQSEREVVLVGNALEAFRRHPQGFPRYRDKADNLSAVVNKCLREAGLLPTDDHTLYSFRHAFEDRLIEIDTPDKVVAAMMGHKFQRPKYGKGPSLELKHRWMAQVALPVRGHVQPPDPSSP